MWWSYPLICILNLCQLNWACTNQIVVEFDNLSSASILYFLAIFNLLTCSLASVFSRYGIHSVPSLLIVRRTTPTRFHGQKDLPSLMDFYKRITGSTCSVMPIFRFLPLILLYSDAIYLNDDKFFVVNLCNFLAFMENHSRPMSVFLALILPHDINFDLHVRRLKATFLFLLHGIFYMISDEPSSGFGGRCIKWFSVCLKCVSALEWSIVEGNFY